MPKVFISHSTLDREFVEREIISLLRAHGIEAWYSTDSIRTAELWEKSIREGLKNCDWFLIVMSPNSVGSKWVPREMLWAMERREGRIIPVLIADCAPEDLHLGLLAIQHIDFRHNIKKAQSELLAIWGVSEEVNELYQKALAEISQANWSEAIECLKKILILDPNHAKAKDELRQARQQKFLTSLYETGLNHFKEGRWQESLEDLRQVQELEGGYKDVVSLIAKAESELANLEEARKRQEKASQVPAASSPDPIHSVETDKSGEEAEKGRESITAPTVAGTVEAADYLSSTPIPETEAVIESHSSIESQESTASLPQAERMRRRHTWIGWAAILISLAIVVIVISKIRNRATSAVGTPPLQSRNLTGTEPSSPLGANAAAPVQENGSPTPTPTPSTVQLRLAQTEGDMDTRNWPVANSNIIIQAGGETFQKKTNSMGTVVFDDVPCGGVVKITAYNSGRGDKVFPIKMGCDKPQVEFVLSQDYGAFKLIPGKPGAARYFDPEKEKWIVSTTGKIPGGSPE